MNLGSQKRLNQAGRQKRNKSNYTGGGETLKEKNNPTKKSAKGRNSNGKARGQKRGYFHQEWR